jgi:alkylresorcinol/alkylpyrone synthase
MSPVVVGTGTAVPEHVVDQSTAREFARGLFGADLPEIDRLVGAFANTGIERRHLCCAPDWYRAPHDFSEKNAIWRREALVLGEGAAQAALAHAAIDRGRVGAIVLVSTTGLATPSLDATLVQRLDLPRSIARVPIWGLGCAGGASGLARAAALVRGASAPVLLVAVELCSTTFVHGDRSKSNLVATALFGDGAAAVVLAPEGYGPRVLGSRAILLDDSQDVMGWRLGPSGLEVVFARSIPALVREIVPDLVGALCREHGVTPAALRHLAVHPGGAKVLDAYADALAVDPERLADAREILRIHGNMSSPTALFVLDRMLRAGTLAAGDLTLLMGLGPGFSAEAVLLG